ncbi:MAG: UDP-3-O-(3-hydroxymyristoyl)glucosamine N-acyltransferase [Candidatus Omnitrophica bacterium]|nr:UDP-3-O-(3-hydroxymyristoyl)glucosamine N-acyltransferase [Candidatus Omnitrophota bacterium]
MQVKVRDVAFFVGGELSGDGSRTVNNLNGAKEAGPNDLAFILDERFEDLIDRSNAACLIIPKNLRGSYKNTVIRVDDPVAAYSKIIEFAMPNRVPHPKGIHSTAVIAKGAKLGRGIALGAYVVIEEGADIGNDTIIYPFCYVGRKTRIGSKCVLYPNVTIRESISIGDRVIIHAGSVIGSDGFGYFQDKNGIQIKIPQIGTIMIEDDVEIGACVTIDRARFDKTIIGKGSKIDNLVQIAHNVVIGPNCIIAAQSGIAGSSELGKNVFLGGQVGVSDHVKLGDFVKVGAQTGISKSFPANTILFGYPAKPIEKAKDTIAAIGLLPKLFERVRALEAKIKELESR